ncbi:hypothetical protein C8Q76DRAFT_600744, partial [Earliella scabrosa]
LLREAEGIISGSLALRFFLEDEGWEPRDMDIYIPEHKFDTFIKRVTDPALLGFTESPPASGDGEAVTSGEIGHNGIRAVQRYHTRTGRPVDIVQSLARTPVLPLQSFWSTLVSNFLTPDACICGFPSPTMNRRGLVKA